jgi:hypothetical protein
MMRALPHIGLALCLGLSACGDPPEPPLDTASPEVLVPPDTLPTPDTLPPEDTALPIEDTLEPDDGPAAPDIPFTPFAEDPSPPFLPPESPPPTPTTCLPIVNPNAETGTLSGWTATEGAFLVESQTSVFEGDDPPAEEGTYYFSGGDSQTSRITQDIALPAGTTARYALLKGLIATQGSADSAYIALEAYAPSGRLARRVNGPYVAESSWRDGLVALAIPGNTTSLRIELTALRGDGIYNDVYFDALTLCLYDQRPRPPIDELHAPPYLMNPSPTSVTVMFETRVRTRARVDFGTSPDRLDRFAEDGPSATTHLIRLTGLEPATRYYYRISYEDLELPVWDLVTARAPDDAGRVEFVVVGDNQDGPATFQALTEEMAALDPDFVLHAGDCVQNGQRKDYRESFFSPLFGLANHAPLIITQGNHETYSSGVFTSEASRELWNEYVDQPGDEHCFGLRWGSLFLLVVDTEGVIRPGWPQFTCIEEALRSENARTATFRMALFHRPPLVEYWDSEAGLPSDVTFFTFGMDAPDVRTYLAPLFEETRVDLVFNGHNHLYQYVPAWPSRVAWVTAGGGGGRLESGIPESRVNDWSPFVDTQVLGRFHYLHVLYERGVIALKAIAEGGEVMHWFEMRAP